MVTKLKETKEFDLRILSRNGSSDADAGVETVQVDYESQDSLVGAIRGYDVVINALSVMAGQAHHAVLDAVIEAQVPRYYPSDWGSHPPAQGRAVPLLQAVPFLDTRRQIEHRVETAAVEGKLTYASLRGGVWLEAFLAMPVQFSLPERKFFMHKYPDVEFSFASKEIYVQGLVNALRLPDEETKNRHFEVELFRASQRKTQELLRQALPELEMEEVAADSEERCAKTLESMKKGESSLEARAGLMSKICLDPEVVPLPARNDNEALGVKRVTEEEFKQILRELQK